MHLSFLVFQRYTKVRAEANENGVFKICVSKTCYPTEHKDRDGKRLHSYQPLTKQNHTPDLFAPILGFKCRTFSPLETAAHTTLFRIVKTLKKKTIRTQLRRLFRFYCNFNTTSIVSFNTLISWVLKFGKEKIKVESIGTSI